MEAEKPILNRSNSFMKHVHLVCNAHLDPVWLWRWQEGCAEAISTFRTAGEIIKENPGFVFCHNEALLYDWVKQHDPVLFVKIKQQVKEGSFHIMGGWYLQPDCNMPSGESIVRNILHGRAFFENEFGVQPKTAVNFDSFGHSRGLIQILNQAGYLHYVICRPGKDHYDFESQDFIWQGYNGSSLIVHRSDENYNSVYGKVAEELVGFLKEKEKEPVTLFLWGVGDHGGGASRKDMQDLAALKQNQNNPYILLHSTPDKYFQELREKNIPLPVVQKGLNPVAPGCYTSQIRVKQKHRLLENELYVTERMCVAAAIQKDMVYPKEALFEAGRDLLFSEFHDALPGSGSQLVEEDTLQVIDHGLYILSREKMKAFMALSEGEESVEDGTCVVLVYNPHPFPVSDVFSFECGLPKQNWDSTFYMPKAYLNGKLLPTQSEMESSHFCIDWRKKVTVQAELAPMSMSRFVIRFEPIEKRPTFTPICHLPEYVFDNGEMRVIVNTSTGLVDSYKVRGTEFLKPGSFELAAYDDTCNSWGLGTMESHAARKFSLLTPHEGSAFSGLYDQVVPSVRVIEDGEVRTVVEAVFGLHHSFAYQRYLLPKRGTDFEVETGVYWNEKDMYLKLEMPTTLVTGTYRGQIPFAWEELVQNSEVVSQKWCGVHDGEHQLAVINDCVYGSSFRKGVIGITLLRSAGYSAANGHYEKTLREVRHTVRMEQGERLYRFRITADSMREVDKSLSQKAQVFNEKPYALAINPPGRGEKCPPMMTVEGSHVMLSALKQAEDGNGYILRLYESMGETAEARIRIPCLNIGETLSFAPFEIRTFRLTKGNISPCPLLEKENM
jgi:alpha-mannosidase